MPRDPQFVALQREFMRALREPIFGESRGLTSLIRRRGKVTKRFRNTAAKWVAATPKLPALERLELYHRQYWYRILDSIAEDFPALKALLGEKVFWRVIEAYLEATPSRSYTLRHLGNKLAAFLAQHPKLTGTKRIHALELVQLEYALCDAFEAADYNPVPAAKLGTAKLALQPHLRLLACRTPADELWRRVVVQEKKLPTRLPKPAARPVAHLVIYRWHNSLRVERIDAGAYALLTGIAQTGSLAAAFKRAKFSADPDTLANVQAWFKLWTERSWICRKDAAKTASTRKTKESRSDSDSGSTDDSLLRRADKSNITRLRF